MSSPFDVIGSRVVPVWGNPADTPAEPTTFVPYNPFGTFTIDYGYGSGGYGDLPYGQGVLGEVTYTTIWTPVTSR
jgi:hypothetical protein